MRAVLKLAVAVWLVIFGVATAAAGQLVAKVDVSSQTMTVSYRGEILHKWKVSTGRKDFDTPRGAWRPQRMAVEYYSRKYDNAPMPYAVFFTGGYAVHGTNKVKALGRPASHGCVRLKTGNAATFYSLVQQVGRKNTRIIVTN
jgi:lipoprotein-anchoring transpeptidase ErfK/SrfK